MQLFWYWKFCSKKLFRNFSYWYAKSKARMKNIFPPFGYFLSWWKWSFYKVNCQKVEFLCNALYVSTPKICLKSGYFHYDCPLIFFPFYHKFSFYQYKYYLDFFQNISIISTVQTGKLIVWYLCSNCYLKSISIIITVSKCIYHNYCTSGILEQF